MSGISIIGRSCHSQSSLRTVSVALSSRAFVASTSRPALGCIVPSDVITSSNNNISTGVCVRSFATGARGARGLGWYTKYREGKGGRHLQGRWHKEKHPDSVEYRAKWNDAIFALNQNSDLLQKAAEQHFGEHSHQQLVPTHVYMDLIGEDWEKPRRVLIELAVAALPRTCSNFIHLCESQDGPDGPVPGYANTTIHKIEKKVALCGGDVLLTDGNNGKCHPSLSELPNGYTFLDEAFVISHSAGTPGIVSMASPGVHKNDSRFTITSTGMEHQLNGKFVAFGRVVDGFDAIEELDTVFTKRGRPANEIKIASCGSLNTLDVAR
jgi:cyclophilin family peptidyl-prolyl cis-trans isomerase